MRAITFDIDWAPDWAIELCASLVAEFESRATFFVTHQSPILSSLERDTSRFEVGLHPNFLQGSTQGGTFSTVLDHCLEIVPTARTLRTHALMQSTPLFELVADRYPQIESDVSLLLPFHEDLRPTDIYLGRSNRRLVRLPYNWEDDIVAEWPGWSWTNETKRKAGLEIYDFHPIHIALNTDRMDRYRSFKASLNGKPLTETTPQDVAPFVNRGEGARSFLQRLLQYGSDVPSFKISDITDLHLGQECKAI